MVVVPSINLQEARNNSGKLCNLGADLLHSDLFSLLNRHCLHLGDCHNLSEARRHRILLLWIVRMRLIGLKSGVDTYSNFQMPYFSLSRHVK